MARPNKGLGHVDGLKGDPEDKLRLKILLATVTGEMLVDEACDELELGPTRSRRCGGRCCRVRWRLCGLAPWGVRATRHS